MCAQNLVSAALTSEQQAAAKAALVQLKASIPALVTLSPQEKQALVKVGNAYEPFLDLANGVTTAHPEIMSGVFNLQEFNKDYQLQKDLSPILSDLLELTEAVSDTFFAARSDAMSESLDVYASVQMNKNKIAGMDTIAAKMAAFFKKSRQQPPTPGQK
ncbi:MAG TPA: hypothetical protein VIS48_08345 [Candidatus Kryptonia bacterium]